MNNIGDEGARMVGEALKSNSTLTRLNLRSNKKMRSNKKIYLIWGMIISKQGMHWEMKEQEC